MGKAEKTKQFIIEQVAPVFNRKGYAATSLKDLTKATGLTKGAIYGNFRNKDEVALSVYKYNALSVDNVLQEKILVAKNYREKLLAYPKTFRAIYRQTLLNGGCPILNTAVDSSDVNEHLQAAVQKTIGSLQRSMVSFIKDGVREGEFAQQTNALGTTQVLICLFEGGFAMSKATRDNGYIENALSHMEFIIKTL